MVKYFEKINHCFVNVLSYLSSSLIFHGRPSRAILVESTVYSCHEVFHDMCERHECNHHGSYWVTDRQLAISITPPRTDCALCALTHTMWPALDILVCASRTTEPLDEWAIYFTDFEPSMTAESLATCSFNNTGFEPRIAESLAKSLSTIRNAVRNKAIEKY